jgi:hypothetical protein
VRREFPTSHHEGFDGIFPAKLENEMNTDEQALLQKMAGTLDEILGELRKGSERHEELDQSNADAEYKRQNPYENV